MAKRYELSGEAWTVVTYLITEIHAEGRPHERYSLMLDSMLRVLCSGAAWGDMLECFGPGSTVYQQFRRWRNQCVCCPPQPPASDPGFVKTALLFDDPS
ncbi:transposase [Pseudomonas cichorii]|uniref:transposase n=1 Tax=Pseudomonas cichorii TaxID=36746 RepID=UPI003908A6D3